jgi:hypothetical protein
MIAGSANVNLLSFETCKNGRYNMTGAPKHGVLIKINCTFTGIMPAHMLATLSTSNAAPDQYEQGTLS